MCGGVRSAGPLSPPVSTLAVVSINSTKLPFPRGGRHRRAPPLPRRARPSKPRHRHRAGTAAAVWPGTAAAAVRPAAVWPTAGSAAVWATAAAVRAAGCYVRPASGLRSGLRRDACVVCRVLGVGGNRNPMQGYLTYKKTHPPRTLP